MQIKTMKGVIAIFVLGLTAFLPFFIFYPTYKELNPVLDLPLIRAVVFFVVFTLPFVLKYLPLAWFVSTGSKTPTPAANTTTRASKKDEPREVLTKGTEEKGSKPKLIRRVEELEKENAQQRKKLRRLKANQTKILNALRSIVDSVSIKEKNQDQN